MLFMAGFYGHAQPLLTPFEKANGNQTPAFAEIID